ncbi:unnamed protein product, partial [Didymodactylos carnosus]
MTTALDTSLTKVLEFLTEAKNLKQTGNELFQTGDLRRTTCLNCAACYIKLNKSEEALGYVEPILQENPNHSKALFRRGQALLMLNMFEFAKADLEKVQQQVPNDESVKTDLQKLKKKYNVMLQLALTDYAKVKK